MTPTDSRRRSSLVKRLVAAFEREVRHRDPNGRALAGLDDLEGAAAGAARLVVDTGEQWREHLGGFYDVDTVRHLLGPPGRPVSKQAVSKRRGLVALRTTSGHVVYPRFQFVEGRLVGGLGEILDALSERLVSRWTVASWLVSANAELDNEAPITVLADGHTAAVVEAAQSWASALAA